MARKLNKKNWTYSEECFLHENWGELNIKTIAKRLNRSIEAVKLKAQRLKLKAWAPSHECITLNQFHILMFGRCLESYTFAIWKREGLPIKKVKKINKTYLMIDFEQFIEWYKNHLTVIDISRTKDGDFGVEPDWLKEKRKADKMAAAYRMRSWTKQEDERLKTLLKTYRYGYREISIMLKRTEGSLKRRMNDLKIMERPLRADNHNPWKGSEIEKVRSLHLKGYKSVVIAEFVNRSALAINGLLERHKYFGKPPLKGGNSINPDKENMRKENGDKRKNN